MFNTFVYIIRTFGKLESPKTYFQISKLGYQMRSQIGVVLVKLHVENKQAMFILINSIILSLKPGLQYQLTK